MYVLSVERACAAVLEDSTKLPHMGPILGAVCTLTTRRVMSPFHAGMSNHLKPQPGLLTNKFHGEEPHNGIKKWNELFIMF